MKKLNRLITLLASFAMLSLTSVSAFSVNAEEIPEPETVVTTTTSAPYSPEMPTVYSVISEFADGSVIDFEGYSAGDFDTFYIQFENKPEEIDNASGQINFDVTVDDTVYTVRFPWEIYSSDTLSIEFSEDYYNGFAYVCWNESYAEHVSEMDSELTAKIYEEVKKCTSGVLTILYTHEREYTDTTTTTTTAPPEYTTTTTTTTTAPAQTTTAPVNADTVTETTASVYLSNVGYVEEECEITVPVYGVQGKITVTSGVESNEVAEVVEIEYYDNMANIHIKGISAGIVGFEVSDENGYSEGFTVQVIPHVGTVTQSTTITTYHTSSAPIRTTYNSSSAPPVYTTSTASTTTTAPPSGTDTETGILYGDANLDGKVDIADVVTVSAYVADSEKNSIEDYGITCGDVQNKGDGLTANDALAIQKFLSGDLSGFC